MSLVSLIPGTAKATLPYRLARSVFHFRQSWTYKRLRQKYARNDDAVIREYLRTHGEAALHVGCGDNLVPGWLNTDYFPDRPDVCHLDATRRFPIPDDSFDLVFSEHMIEHLPLSGGMNMLKECWRIMKPGGRIRISTPPLETVAAIYLHPEADGHKDYIEWHFRTWLDDAPLRSPAVIANDFVRNWGHLFIYDEPTLRQAMATAGFIDLAACELNESSDPRLANLENEVRMPPGLLKLTTMTVEGVKPPR